MFNVQRLNYIIPFETGFLKQVIRRKAKLSAKKIFFGKKFRDAHFQGSATAYKLNKYMLHKHICYAEVVEKHLKQRGYNSEKTLKSFTNKCKKLD